MGQAVSAVVVRPGPIQSERSFNIQGLVFDLPWSRCGGKEAGVSCRLSGPEKTCIVYCKDGKRRGSHEHTRFTFLGYEFGVRRARAKSGRFFENFGPAISPEAATAIRHEMRSWHMARHTRQTLVDLAEWANPRVQGWINYYGAFYRSALHPIFLPLNDHLARWARRKYKRLGRRRGQSYEFIKRVYRERPTLFAHWRLGVRP